jgi:tripartite-type tricarboxylate transporter receptor subunit TctC
MQRRQFLSSSAAAVGLCAAGDLAAQERGPLSIVVPVGPGSTADTTSRILGDLVSKSLGRTVIVENKPGADTMISLNHVLAGPTDGSRVLFLSPSPVVLNPLLNKSLTYDPDRDITPIMLAQRGGTLLISRSGKYASLKDFIEDARKNPGKVSVATYAGHWYRLLALMIGSELNLNVINVPYKEPTPALTDLIGGNVDAMVIDGVGAREFYNAKKITALAITQEKRADLFPDVPTFAELGYPELTAYVWLGFAVKGGTPPDVVARLYQAFHQALFSKEYSDYLNKIRTGQERLGLDGAQARKYIESERARFRNVIEKTGYKG